MLLVHTSVKGIFQSTHPAGGETESLLPLIVPSIYFNPLTPRGVRLRGRRERGACADFNPLTPRGVRPHFVA